MTPRRLAGIALGFAALLLTLAGPPTARANDDDAAPPSLPFPAARGEPGQTARYRVVDPEMPAIRLGARTLRVEASTDDAILVSSDGEPTRLPGRGEEAKRAAGVVRALLGSSAKRLLPGATLRVTADAIEVAARRYDDAVRIDATLRIDADERLGAPEVEATYRIWVSASVSVLGIVRADAEVKTGDRVTRTRLELEAEERE